MKQWRPIEIVGGGLAGLSLGIALRRQGVDVSILEAGDYPRHRVCGEFIVGLSPSTIDNLGMAPALSDCLEHRSVHWLSHGRLIRSQALPEPALGISRQRLDLRLADLFRSLGGKLHTLHRSGADQAAGRIIACGRTRERSPWIGLKVHALDFESKEGLEVHLGSGAYVGLSRVEDGRTNVCGLFRRRPSRGPRERVLHRALEAAGFGHLARRMEKARLDETSLCAVAGLRFCAPPPRTGLWLGDAFSATAPFTGNGMAMAFQSSEAVLPAVLAYAEGHASWEEACREGRRCMQRRFRVRLKSSQALHPYFLHPSRQKWLLALGSTGLLPMKSLYRLLH